MSRSILTAVLVLFPALAGVLTAQESPAEGSLLERDTTIDVDDDPSDWDRPIPPGFPIGSFSSMLAGRVDADATIDSGSGLLVMTDGATGEAAVPQFIAYGRGPTLSVTYQTQLAGFDLDVAIAADPTSPRDTRLVVGTQVRIVNRSLETVSGSLVFELRPGEVIDPHARPEGALEFVSGTSFSEQDGFVLRDGAVVMGWNGVQPRVFVAGEVSSPDDLGATYTYDVSLPPGGVTYLEVKLAGPSHADEPDEDRFRKAFDRRTMSDLEEVLHWQWQFRGAFAAFQSGVDGLRKTMVGCMHVLRLFGLTHFQTRVLSDRPYGHPPRDAAVEGEIFGTMLQYNLEEILAEHTPRLLGRLEDDLATLSPERRVAHLYGLVQGMRVAPGIKGRDIVARAVLDHVETVPVRPWLDPDVVHRDLVDFVRTVGLDGADEIAPLAWAELEDDGSTPALMQTCRRALSAGDAEGAWASYSELMSRGTVRGMGAYEVGGEIDGRYSIGMLALLRDMLIDDHSGDLAAMPEVSRALVLRHAPLSFHWMPTRYGLIKAQVYFAGKKTMGAWVRYMPGDPAERVLVSLPEGIRARRLFGKPLGGEAQILKDDRVRVWVDRESAEGLRLSVAVGNLFDVGDDEADDADPPEDG